MFNSPRETNGILDLGTTEQKEKLFQFKELVPAASGVSLAQTSPDRWKVYPRRNQDGSNTCVYQARAKAAGILNEMATGEFIEYSAADYNKRSNKPAAGAYPVESFDFWRKEGIGLEILEPSQEIDDVGVEKVKQTAFSSAVAKVSLLDAYFALPAYDFDALISTLHATKKPIPLGFFGTYQEWSRDVPTVNNPILTPFSAEVRHEVCATPNFGIWNGEEGFTIEDSWGSTGIGGMGVRWITRSFFTKRNYIPGLVPTTFKSFGDIGIDPQKPKHTFNKDLAFGMTDSDVFHLQSVLKYEGFFPANHAGSNYFGSITQKGVQGFQAKHGIVSSGTPATTGYGRVGEKTRAVLNELYS